MPHEDPVELGIPILGYDCPAAVLVIVWLGQVPVTEMLVPATIDGVAVPDPPCATLNGVVKPVKDVMSPLAPDTAALRFERAPEAVVAPVPPDKTGSAVANVKEVK